MLRLFDFNCAKCGHTVERIVRDGEVIHCPICWQTGCNVKMDRQPPVFNVNRGPVPITGYYDDNLESYVRTNTHRRELMREKGVSERGETPKNRGTWV